MNKKYIWCLGAAFCVLAGCESDNWKPPVPSEDAKCSPESCLAADGHEGWAKAECRDDDSCKVIRCSNGYRLRDDRCLPILECCGADCINCPDNTGWVEGACKGGKCVAEQCEAGYRLLPKKDGEVDCVADSSLTCCGDACTNCAAGEGLKSVVCKVGKCVAEQCRKGYRLSPQADGSVACEPEEDSACCGDACANCTAVEGWKTGACIDGKCVAEQCKTDYQLLPKADGSVVCEFNADVPPESMCSGKVCPSGQKCDEETGMCVCGAGYTSCDDGCYNLKNDDEHCGKCNTACGDVPHGTGYCAGGVCKVNCLDGYFPSEDGLSCVENGEKCLSVGASRCSDSVEGMVISRCNENKEWETVKTCNTNKGVVVAGCSDSDCSVTCGDGYIQNQDSTACELLTDPCPAAEFRCNFKYGDYQIFNCSGDKWSLVKTCEYAHTKKLACTADGSNCNIECNPGYNLTYDGTKCEFDTQATCTDGETRCSGLEFHKCVNHHWTVVEECELEGKYGGGMRCDQKKGCERWCFDDKVLCGKGCADLKNDFDHCGSCDNVCASGKCVNGVCL